MNVYGSPHEENKAEFLTELASFCGTCQDPFLAGGDFNLFRFTNEKNKSTILSKHSGTFNSIISCYDLLDLSLAGGRFTWSNNQASPTLVKLDRTLVSQSWEDVFPRVMVYKLTREISDHNPLILQSTQQQTMRNLSFKFELMWLKDSDFLPLVNKIWSKPFHGDTTFDRIQLKLKRFK